MNSRLFRDLQKGTSVEERIRRAVRKLNPEARLEVVMGVVGIGLEAEEKLQDIVVETWDLVVKEEWWRARYKTFSEFMKLSGVADGVADMIHRRARTDARKWKYES